MLGRKRKVYKPSCLDHWNNYQERFNYKKMILPDEIWVTDKYAYKLAIKNFKDIRVTQKNYYELNLLKNLKKI